MYVVPAFGRYVCPCFRTLCGASMVEDFLAKIDLAAANMAI